MDDVKQWWQSKTLWVNGIAVLAVVIQSHTGFVLDIEAQATILAAINIILRFITRQPLNSWKNDAGKIAPLLVLGMILTGCAGIQGQSPQAIAAKALLSTRQGVIAAATTADTLCTQGVMTQADCDRAEETYTLAQQAYGTAADAFLVYLVADDELSKQLFENTQPRLQALHADLAGLVKSVEGGAR